MFDVDGTLTEPRQKMSQEFQKFFTDWMEGKIVYLVTGSDIQKLKEQVPQTILDKCEGLFVCMGNELYQQNKVVYKNDYVFPETLVEWLREQIKVSKYDELFETNFEFRTGMMNFSIVGRQATKEQRERYYKWDSQNKERQHISNYINKTHPDLEACVGGQISIDIQPKGKDKRQSLDWIKTKHSEPVYFFGDRCEPGGNDYGLAKELSNLHSGGYYRNVRHPEDLQEFLNNLNLEEEIALDNSTAP